MISATVDQNTRLTTLRSSIRLRPGTTKWLGPGRPREDFALPHLIGAELLHDVEERVVVVVPLEEELVAPAHCGGLLGAFVDVEPFSLLSGPEDPRELARQQRPWR